MMNRLADLLDRHADEFGLLESMDNGKLLRETTAQVRFAARLYRFYAGYADKLYGTTIPLDAPGGYLDYTVRQPLGGVAVLITAWNSPMQLLANKLAPALAAGNTVVIKPSEQASLTTLLLGRLIVRAGFPPGGVVNIVSGGLEAGVALTSRGDVDRISFTGSVETGGRAISAAAAKTLVPVTLELGGKSPNIIFDDADVDEAVAGAMAGIFSAGGQTCVAGSRLLVQRSLYDASSTRSPNGRSAFGWAIRAKRAHRWVPSQSSPPVRARPRHDRERRGVGCTDGRGWRRIGRGRGRAALHPSDRVR